MTLKPEDLRHAVLQVLSVRHPAALPPQAIRRRIWTEKLVDENFTDTDLQSALTLLMDKGLVRFVQDNLGPSQYWVATAEGVLAWERAGV